MAAQAAPKKNLSTIKRVRQAEAQELINRSVKSKLKTLCKKVDKAVTDKNTGLADAALKEAVSAIDKAARKGIIHKNTAARKVSGLSRRVNSIPPSEAV